MRLLASTDLALRVLMYLAGRDAAHPVNVATLASALGGQSRNHLHKIAQDLRALGVVRTVRGAGGGVLLATAPNRIRVGTLVRQLEGYQPIVECFRADGGCCTLRRHCRLSCFIGTAREDFYRSLDRHTVADCLPDSGVGAVTMPHLARRRGSPVQTGPSTPVRRPATSR